MKPMYVKFLVLLLIFCFSCARDRGSQKTLFEHAYKNGILANEGFRRCNDYMVSWLNHADSLTGLIPRNLYESYHIWNARDAAADNYPFMVLTSSITSPAVFEGTMHDMLASESSVTPRLGKMPDTYSFIKQGFDEETIDTASIIFGASEYIKDGLLPLTEWLGYSPWSVRLVEILDDIWAYAPVSTEFGSIPSLNVEVNGEMLQALSRIYWMSGNEKYLDWAVRLGDFYLLGDHHPTRDLESLRLRDHGCEIVSGLCELYCMVSFARPDKKEAYKGPVYEMLDRILEAGTNEHGLFYNVVNPISGEIINDGIADTWGYTYNGFYTVYMIDGPDKYREAVIHALENIDHYKAFDWEHGSADGYADAIESALNLYNREPLTGARDWIESETAVMWSMQDSSHREQALEWKGSGIIEGWHGDGNFARTSIMYCLWKTQGITVQPWREDIIFGALQDNEKLYISFLAEHDWDGVIKFDFSRSEVNMNLPLDYPRINQFPEWFVVSDDTEYRLEFTGDNRAEVIEGKILKSGLPIKMDKGRAYHLVVEAL
ncbi:MAG: hypothetical protein AMS26_20700 [Bacteroides sp. SM23_62]|nr:MAG: hypothetical protein AMS26_20700 [Bacteroides sp. SM23_62]